MRRRTNSGSCGGIKCIDKFESEDAEYQVQKRIDSYIAKNQIRRLSTQDSPVVMETSDSGAGGEAQSSSPVLKRTAEQSLEMDDDVKTMQLVLGTLQKSFLEDILGYSPAALMECQKWKNKMIWSF